MKLVLIRGPKEELDQLKSRYSDLVLATRTMTEMEDGNWIISGYANDADIADIRASGCTVDVTTSGGEPA